MPDRPDIELADKAKTIAAERGVSYGEGMRLALAEDESLAERYSTFTLGESDPASPPDPNEDAMGYIEHLLRVHDGKVPEQLLIPDATPRTLFNVRVALAEASGLTFEAASARVVHEHPELATAVGLSLSEDGTVTALAVGPLLAGNGGE
jgi:hypothetical protein